MDDVTNPEIPTLPVEEEEVTPQPSDDAEAENEDGESQTLSEDEAEEVEWEGVKLALPKTLAPKFREGWLRQDDYTRKTQEVAERRRELEAQAQAIETARTRAAEQAKADEAIFADRVKVAALDEQLEAYTPEVWTALQQRDATSGTNETQAHLLRVRQLEAQREKLNRTISDAQSKRELEAKQETAKRDEEARAAYMREVQAAQQVLAKKIGWNRELAQRTEVFGRQIGLSDEELGIMAKDARFVELVHLARIGAEAQQKRTNAVKPQAQPQPQPVQQVRTSRGASAATKAPSDKDSPEVWMKKRNEQLYGNKRA